MKVKANSLDYPTGSENLTFYPGIWPYHREVKKETWGKNLERVNIVQGIGDEVLVTVAKEGTLENGTPDFYTIFTKR